MKNKCFGSHQKKKKKLRGQTKIPYHQKNACISHVSKDRVVNEERGSYFVVVKIRRWS